MSIEKSYGILDSMRLPNGLYIASPSIHYSAVWIRDSLYISLPFLNKTCNTYERTIHRLLDLMLDYEWKIDIHIADRPREPWQYIHAKYDAHNVKEISEAWGHAQHDAVGMLLWSIGEGERHGKRIIRNSRDRDMVQKLVYYLRSCEYWQDKDNGMWEEHREVHASSVGACVAGLRSVSYLVDVPQHLVTKGLAALEELGADETDNRVADMAQLSLVYPYRVYSREMAVQVIAKVEKRLLRANGVARYEGDSYYSTVEHDGRHQPLAHYFGTEAEWCLGLPWLAICHMELGNFEEAQAYIEQTEKIILPDGSIPELYYAKSQQYNPNTPLGWANALYLVAKERMNKLQR
ncbi:MAG: glycoside hydrolase family 15 [Taibaiella sp.]|nr:glycoside hydrolase family 15 [Taibaiella sp.]